jgi:hypothetical protein
MSKSRHQPKPHSTTEFSTVEQTVVPMLCSHGGACAGPAVPLTATDSFVVPCLSLAFVDHTRAQPENVEAFRSGGWAVAPIRRSGKVERFDVVLDSAGSLTPGVAVARVVLQMHNAREIVCSAPVLDALRLHLVTETCAPPKGAPKTTVPAPRAPNWIEVLGDTPIVTVDMDGCMYDPWQCHGIKGNFRSSDGCTHVRQDTLDAIHAICEATGAVPIVLSWRSGMYQTTKDWADEVGLGQVATVVPGSPDDPKPPYSTAFGYGQVGFKASTVKALMDHGVNVIASFDDNSDVCDAMRRLGVADVRQVPRLVSVSDAEWSAGRLGAKSKSSGSYGRTGGYSQGQMNFLDKRPRSTGARTGKSDSPDWMIEDDLLERIESGEATYGMDYTVDEDGEFVSLHRNRPTSLHSLSDGDPEFLDGAKSVNDAVNRAQSLDRRLADEAQAFLAQHRETKRAQRRQRGAA